MGDAIQPAVGSAASESWWFWNSEADPLSLRSGRLRLDCAAGPLGRHAAESSPPPAPGLLLLRPLVLQVRTKDVLFESISHLIDYHLQNGQPIVAAESELHLRGVVKREP